MIENACGGGYGNIDLASMDMHKAGKNADCYSMLEKHEEWIEEWFQGITFNNGLFDKILISRTNPNRTSTLSFNFS